MNQSTFSTFIFITMKMVFSTCHHCGRCRRLPYSTEELWSKETLLTVQVAHSHFHRPEFKSK